MSENKKKPRNGIVYLVSALMFLAIAYGFKKSSDYNKLEDTFISEQEEIQEELDELIQDYKNAKTNNTNLSIRLKNQMNKIISLRDSVKQISGGQFGLILKFRKRVSTLERENHDLFVELDSLKLINKDLHHQNILVVEQLKDKSEFAEKLQINNTELKSNNTELEQKVKVASIVKISPMKVIAMKERSSGKLVTTNKSSRTDAFKTTFNLLGNKLADTGKKNTYVQLVDKNGRVVASKGTFTTINGKKNKYSGKSSVFYKKNEIKVLSLILVNRDDIKSGTYKVNVFVDRRYQGTTSITLK